MENSIELLSQILAESDPQDTIYLAAHQAELIAALPPREIGSLWYAISDVGAVEALQREGLFSRSVVIVQDQQDHLMVAPARRGAAA
jgi:hypothetical protein